MSHVTGAYVKPHNIAVIIDPAGRGGRAAREIQCSEIIAAQHIAMEYAIQGVVSDDLAAVVDAKRLPAGTAGEINGSEIVAPQQEAMRYFLGINVRANNVVPTVDAPGLRTGRAWIIDRRELAPLSPQARCGAEPRFGCAPIAHHRELTGGDGDEFRTMETGR